MKTGCFQPLSNPLWCPYPTLVAKRKSKLNLYKSVFLKGHIAGVWSKFTKILIYPSNRKGHTWSFPPSLGVWVYKWASYGNYRDSCEAGSDPLTTKVFTSRHVHLKQQDIYATGRGPKKETLLKRDMLGGREYFLSSHSVNYNPEKVQHSFTEHLLNATHYVFIWLSLNPRSYTARYVLLSPFHRNRNGKKYIKWAGVQAEEPCRVVSGVFGGLSFTDEVAHGSSQESKPIQGSPWKFRKRTRLWSQRKQK